MMRTVKNSRATLVALLLPVVLLLPAEAHAQSVEGGLEALALENAQRYVHPIATGLSMALGTGFANTARTHGLLGFDLGVRAMGSFVPEDGKFFNAVLPEAARFGGQNYPSPYGFDGSSTGRTPTAAGDGSGVVIVPQGAFRDAIEGAGENPDDYNLQFPEGLDVPAVPFAIIQGSVGVGFGTDVVLRLVPAYEVSEDVGEISAFGFGVKHSVDQWLPPLFPVHLSALAGWQSFEVGEYLDATSLTMGLIASKGFGPFSLYGTGAYESSNLDVRYTVSNPDDNPALPADGTDFAFSFASTGGTRGAVGLGFKLLILDMSAEYAVGSYNTASIKVGLSFN